MRQVQIGVLKIYGRDYDAVEPVLVRKGDRILIKTAGGGGYGDPQERDAERIAADVRNGLVSPDFARDLYGAVVDADGRIDMARPQANRIVRG